MRIIALSDTHGFEVQVPDGDVLIHAGDFSNHGTDRDVLNFGLWFRELPHKHKIVIAGNHDKAMQGVSSGLNAINLASWDIRYLEDSGIEIDGVKFYGSPWTPTFGVGWAFNADIGKEIGEHWAKIPDDTEVLITHGPAAGILDKCGYIFGDASVGCPDLYDSIKNMDCIHTHIFGHIHDSYGQSSDLEPGRIISYNVSICTEDYRPTNKPTVIDI